jgi:hypothetical protein
VGVSRQSSNMYRVATLKLVFLIHADAWGKLALDISCGCSRVQVEKRPTNPYSNRVLELVCMQG